MNTREGHLPPRLARGDTLRVVAPARSLALIGRSVQRVADQRLQGLGFRLTMGRHVQEADDFASTTIAHRVADLQAAFAEPEVKVISTVIGGYNSNQLLRALDYRLIEEHPKVLCGYSDITALLLAIHARTGLVTYYGPHYSTFGDAEGADYTIDQFTRTLFGSGPLDVSPSPKWSEDEWFRDLPARNFLENPGPVVLQPGRAEGVLLGGNLCTVNLLQGTEFLPDVGGRLLFVEDVGEAATPVFFDRNLQALLHQKGGDKITGLLIGRFQSRAGMTAPLLERIIRSKPELEGKPVVAGFDFGHTTPMMTLPIGGRARIDADGPHPSLQLLSH